jgi:hypothetical protein
LAMLNPIVTAAPAPTIVIRTTRLGLIVDDMVDIYTGYIHPESRSSKKLNTFVL